MSATTQRDGIRIWVAITALIVAAVLAGGFVFGVQPQLQAAAASASAESAARTRVLSLKAELVSLREKAQDIRALRAARDKVASAVPDDLDAQSFIDRLNVVADDDDLKVKGISPGKAMAYASPTVVADAAPASGPSPTPRPGATAAPVVVASKQSVTDPRITGANLIVIPMTVSVSGAPDDVYTFVDDVQHDKRLYLVNGLSVSVTDDSGSTSDAATSGSGGSTGACDATLTGFIYALRT